MIGRAADHALIGLRIKCGDRERFFLSITFKEGRVQRLLYNNTIPIPVADQRDGPDQGLGPDGKDGGPFVDGGLLAKERQEKRFTSAGIVIREKRRVPVLPECPQYGKSRFPVPDDVRPMRRAQPRGDVIHQLVFIRPHDRQARMVGYIPKQAGQQLPSPEMCRCYHAGALSSFETLQQIRALHVEQGMGQAEFGNKDRLKERTGVVREAGPCQRLRRCLRKFKVPCYALRGETTALGQTYPEQGAKPPGKRTDTGKAEFAEQKGEAIAHPAHGPGKHLGKLEEQ